MTTGWEYSLPSTGPGICRDDKYLSNEYCCWQSAEAIDGGKNKHFSNQTELTSNVYATTFECDLGGVISILSTLYSHTKTKIIISICLPRLFWELSEMWGKKHLAKYLAHNGCLSAVSSMSPSLFYTIATCQWRSLKMTIFAQLQMETSSQNLHLCYSLASQKPCDRSRDIAVIMSLRQLAQDFL